jgi:hypothetical protein
MTSLPKLGINPMSEWHTPIGIYCYPLKEVWEKYNFDNNKSVKELPYVSTAPYIQVFEWNGKGKFVNVDDYNSYDLDKDVEIIKRLYRDKVDDIDDVIENAIYSANRDKDASKLFNILNKLPRSYSNKLPSTVQYTKRIYNPDDKKYDEYVKEYSNYGRIAANILKSLGYAGFVDYGTGVIHKNEPTQAFFLSTDYINHLDTILNKDYVRYTRNKDTAQYGGLYIGEIYKKALILAPKKYEKGFNYYQDAVDYVKSLPGKWVIPSKQDFLLIGGNLKMLSDDYKFLNYDNDEVSYWTSSYQEYKHDDTKNIVFEYHNDNNIDFGTSSTGWSPAEGEKPLDDIYYYVRPIKLV